MTWGALITGSQHRLRAITRAGGCLWLFLALLPYQFASAQANSEETSPEAPFFLEIPEVLSATRLAQHPKDAPAAVFVIDREMIEASGAREIADLLRLAPGFIVASEGTFKRAVGYRGFVDSVGRRLQVLIDGRSAYMPFFGGTNWSDLPVAIDDIARIEVIRGPNGASHGANAFQGVVNILTRHPDASQGIYLRAATGSPDYAQGVFRHGLTRGPMELRYTLGYEEDSGYQAFLDNVVDDKQLGLATVDMMIDASPRDRLRLQAGLKSGRYQDGGNDIEYPAGAPPFIRVPTVEDPPRWIDVDHLFGQVDWEHELGNEEQLKVLAYVQQLEHKDDFPTLLDPAHPDNPIGADIFVDFSRSREERRYAVELQHLLRPHDDLRMVWGGELRRDEADSRSLFGPGNPVDNTLFRIFANAEWRLTQEFLVNAGVMLEDYDLYESAISPRLALSYSPSASHTFRVSASRSVRAPSMQEARADEYFPLDIDLGAGLDGEIDAIFQDARSEIVPDNETVDALELGWLFDLSVESGLRGDIKLFYERYRKMLVDYPYGYTGRDDLGACVTSPLPPAPSGYCVNINDGSSNLDEPNPVTYGIANQIDLDFYGIEATLEIRPSHRSRVIGSYTLNRSRNLDARNPALLDYNYSDFGLDPFRQDPTLLAKVKREWGQSYPSHIFSLLGILRPTPDVTLSASIYHLSDTQFLEVGDDLPGYTRLDLRAAYRMRLDDKWQAEVYGVVQNTGSDYLDFEQFNSFETRAFAGIKIYQ